MIQKLLRFFDKFEDRVRGYLSHRPIAYGVIGGIGIVLFWRGVWHIADDMGLSSLTSFIAGVILLLATGLLVSVFIGDQLIISGLQHEKKITEKTEAEVEAESDILARLRKELNAI